MKPTEQHMHAAHLWLFAACIDPNALDSKGIPLVQSLACSFALFQFEGRCDISDRFVQGSVHDSGIRRIDPEETGRYERSELDSLLVAAGAKK